MSEVSRRTISNMHDRINRWHNLVDELKLQRDLLLIGFFVSMAINVIMIIAEVV